MSGINLTAREQELLCAVVEVMKADIKWPEVARIANFTNAKQARDKWPSVRNKLVANNKAAGGGDDSAAALTSKTKKGPSKRKAASENDDDVESKPSKKKKKSKVKAEVKDESDSGSGDYL